MLLVLGWLVGAFRINLFAGVLGADVSLAVDGNVDLTPQNVAQISSNWRDILVSHGGMWTNGCKLSIWRDILVSHGGMWTNGCKATLLVCY